MSDGLNLFDEKASAVGGFPQVFRGYDRESVDAYIADLERDLRAARHEARQLTHEAEVTRASQGDTDFSRLGAHATALLAAAERQAAELLHKAGLEADRLRAAAVADATERRERVEKEAIASRDEGKEQLRRLRLDAEERAAGQLAASRTSGEQIIAAAQSRAASLEADAKAGAEETRRLAGIEAARIVNEAEAKAAEIRTSSLAEQQQTLARLREQHDEITAASRAALDEARERQEASAARLTSEAQQAAAMRAKAIADAEQIRHLAHKAASDQSLADQRAAQARADRLERNHGSRRETLSREIEVLETRKAAIIAQLEALAKIAQEGGRAFVDSDDIREAASTTVATATQGRRQAFSDLDDEGAQDTRVIPVVDPAEAHEPTVVMPEAEQIRAAMRERDERDNRTEHDG